MISAAIENSGGKNAIPPCGRKRIFAESGATPLKNIPKLLHCVFKKGCGLFYLIP
jgi:hypothetical protein